MIWKHIKDKYTILENVNRGYNTVRCTYMVYTYHDILYIYSGIGFSGFFK